MYSWRSQPVDKVGQSTENEGTKVSYEEKENW